MLVVIGAIAAGGAAFTASNTVPNTTAGYGTSTITGATATDIAYTLSPDGTSITGATITFTGDLSNDTVKAGFETDNLTTCSAPVYDGSASSTSTCSGFTESTASSSTFNVAVTNN
ncbi:MAG TPA: hypothetical protein VMF14_12775 [Solirubrobacteraceae bacterium]|nr:hypothetical protein [Solirubrobacteraceae bacterium]